MISKKQGALFAVELKPSQKLRRLLIVIHGLALGAGFANALPLAVKLAIGVAIGLNFKFGFPKLINEHRKIKYTEKLGWEVADGSDFEAATILKSTVVTTFFIFLHIQNKPTILITSDALDNDDYRQLIVKLKMTVHDLP